jgi:2-polyprenyl-3-methyl-5-hydroxy-6-metoxy-1,4-benzoquinol methylase
MADYGSVEWLEQQYQRTGSDPWGLDWRPTQLYRYGCMLAEVRRCLAERKAPSERVLDVGCATGEFSDLLRRSLPESSERAVTGMDLSTTAIERAHQRYPQVEFRTGGIEDQPADFEGAFDLVSCLEVLYYLPADRRGPALAALQGVLKPGGLLLISSMIGKSPHMNYVQLAEIVEQHFQIIADGRLTLWPLTSLEKIALKVARFVPRTSIDRYLPGRSGFSTMQRLSTFCGTFFGSSAESHAYIVAIKA